MRFHILIQSAPGRSLPTFDEALDELAKLPRLFIEPDGSFVWTGGDEAPWQVDGNLIDQGLALAYVELKGHCPPQKFERMLRALGWPQMPVVFQLPQRGVTLDEGDFMQMARSDGGAI